MDRKQFINAIKLLKTSIVLNIWTMLIAGVGITVFSIILFASLAFGSVAVLIMASGAVIFTGVACMVIYIFMFVKIFKGLNQVAYIHEDFIKAKQAVIVYLVVTVVNVFITGAAKVNAVFQSKILGVGISAIMVVSLFMMYYYTIKAINEALLNEGDTEVCQNGLSVINFYKITMVVVLSALFLLAYPFSVEAGLIGLFMTIVSMVLMLIVLFSIIKYYKKVIEFFERLDHKTSGVKDFSNLSHGMQDSKL